MARTSDQKSVSTPQVPVTAQSEDVEFERWAVAVKRQMIAALKRKELS